jgi:hypothetical protein
MIQIADTRSDSVYSVSVEFFLRNFYCASFRYIPPDGHEGGDDLGNLIKLFQDLKEKDSALAYRSFLMFHAWNARNNVRIFWELL